MTFLEAAIHILKTNNNVSMNHKEIWCKIDEQKLVKTDGKTPWASLNTIMLYASVDSPIDSEQLKKEPEKNRNIFDLIKTERPQKFKLNDLYLKNRYKDIFIEEQVQPQEELPTLLQEVEEKEIIVKESIKKNREIIYQMTNEELDWKCLTIFKDDDHLEYEITNIREYTYIFDDNNTLIKIGKTSQETPVNRLNGMKTANPAIHIDIVFPATLYKEKHLHDKYDDFRQQNNREWFFKSKKIISFIDEHKKKNDIAMEWYHKQKDIDIIEKQIINW